MPDLWPTTLVHAARAAPWFVGSATAFRSSAHVLIPWFAMPSAARRIAVAFSGALRLVDVLFRLPMRSAHISSPPSEKNVRSGSGTPSALGSPPSPRRNARYRSRTETTLAYLTPVDWTESMMHNASARG